MKYLVLIIFIFSCGKREEINKLSDAERTAISERASLKCVSSNAGWMEEFKEQSDKQMLESSNFKRGKYYKHSFKISSETNNYITNDIYIYKQDVSANELYILVKKSQGQESTDIFWYFVRITSTYNEDMITNLRAKLCAEAVSKVSATNSYAVIQKDLATGANSENGNNQIYFDETYDFAFSRPAFFGPNFGIKRRKYEKDSNGKEVSNTSKTYESKWEAVPASGDNRFVVNPVIVGNYLDRLGDGLDDNDQNQVFYYCEGQASTGNFKLILEKSNCQINSSGIPGTWDLSL